MSNWLNFSQNSGVGDTNVVITATSNNLLSERTAQYKVSSGSKNKIITVRQKISTSLDVQFLTVVYNIQNTGVTEITHNFRGEGLYVAFDKYRVDGGEWITTSYWNSSCTHTFTTTGEHVIEYVPHNNAVPYDKVHPSFALRSEYPFYYFNGVPPEMLSGITTAVRVYIPDYITLIGDYALQSGSIEYVQLHDNITFIGIYGCAIGQTPGGTIIPSQHIIDVVVPKKLNYASLGSFSPGTNFNHYIIDPDCEMTYIDCASFNEARFNTKTIVIPSSVQIIYASAFAGLAALTDIYAYPKTAPTLSNDVYYDTLIGDSLKKYPFYGVKSGGTLHYPAGSNYSSWMKNELGFLGYRNWTAVADL